MNTIARTVIPIGHIQDGIHSLPSGGSIRLRHGLPMELRAPRRVDATGSGHDIKTLTAYEASTVVRRALVLHFWKEDPAEFICLVSPSVWRDARPFVASDTGVAYSKRPTSSLVWELMKALSAPETTTAG